MIHAVPFGEHREIAKALPSWKGKTVIDAMNTFGVPAEKLDGLTQLIMLLQSVWILFSLSSARWAIQANGAALLFLADERIGCIGTSIARKSKLHITTSAVPMTAHERMIALGVLQALNAARLVPGDAELAKASAMAIPERGIRGDLHREHTFIAIRNLRLAIDEGESSERLSALYSAALAATCVWVEARSGVPPANAALVLPFL